MKLSGEGQAELIKIAALLIGGIVVLGGAWYLVNKGLGSLTGAFDGLISMPGKVMDSVALSTKEAGAGWQNQYKEQAPEVQAGTGKKYEGPLINNGGMDFSPFGGLSG